MPKIADSTISLNLTSNCLKIETTKKKKSTTQFSNKYDFKLLIQKTHVLKDFTEK